MKVHLVKKQTIENFTRNNAASRPAFMWWLTIIKSVRWEQPSDILATFGSADLLGNGTDKVVFNIGGNHYRMICHYVFGQQETHLFVCWIGTHAAYTRLCNDRLQYTVSNF
ncbi:mRNA interferase HigB [Chitinophaga costaii]|uniref:mRNA interferase HigB n=1 Tax=Chitinophaga costaii TaxID=1335309 RepID=A0A1C4EQP7_9BACT|nr:type II toxin-antitoxin system HigB family toxin [Chitinophaga costaii]PUZ22523.1 type II toxin-antitoxin system HigB family toxin [Chitinophaga costaii]SCC45901.1 mRNA interferase HigB [Chitinophaga costaii]